MSTLRQIMQKLAEVSSKQAPAATRQAEGGEVFKLHVDEYQTNLETCSKTMLQYEWAWWKEHIEALELSLILPEMHEQIGGKESVERLLAESRACQNALADAMNAKMVHPAGHSHQIHPSEHAWELSQESMRRDWQIV